MNLNEMRTKVRRDLHDEDEENYRWTNDEVDSHIAHTVRDFSNAIPLEQKATKATTSGLREIDISSLSDRIMIQAVEYPVGQFPKRYQRFACWGDTLALLGNDVPDGSNAYIYYGNLHTLNSQTSTIPQQYEDLISEGACGYAAIELAVYSINRLNIGSKVTSEEFQNWGREKLKYFRGELKRLGRRNRVLLRQLYQPYHPPVSKTTDYGP